MSGGYRLEILVPSKRLAVFGSSCVCRPALPQHLHRVDAQWECGAVHKVQYKGKPLTTGEIICRFFDHSLIYRCFELSEVMAGMAYLHGLKIVHGDLKGVSTALLTCISSH